MFGRKRDESYDEKNEPPKVDSVTEYESIFQDWLRLNEKIIWCGRQNSAKDYTDDDLRKYKMWTMLFKFGIILLFAGIILPFPIIYIPMISIAMILIGLSVHFAHKYHPVCKRIYYALTDTRILIVYKGCKSANYYDLMGVIDVRMTDKYNGDVLFTVKRCFFNDVEIVNRTSLNGEEYFGGPIEMGIYSVPWPGRVKMLMEEMEIKAKKTIEKSS